MTVKEEYKEEELDQLDRIGDELVDEFEFVTEAYSSITTSHDSDVHTSDTYLKVNLDGDNGFEELTDEQRCRLFKWFLKRPHLEIGEVFGGYMNVSYWPQRVF